jgi:N-acetylmuramoyl-L-alanine amidase
MVKVTGKRIVIEFVVFSVVFGIIAALLGKVGYDLARGEAVDVISETSVKPTVIIDAGHGGEDGGATGVNGVLEKKLNLEVADKLGELLKLFGYNVIMTREADISLGESAPKGQRKMTDLKRRLEIADSNPDAIFVSIHMNKYPAEDCRGIQVWYSPNNEDSYRLAGIIRNTVRTKLQPDNNRENKSAGSSIYLLNRMKNVSVLVECGFLSNPGECAALCDRTYQTRLASALYYAIDEFATNVG